MVSLATPTNSRKERVRAPGPGQELGVELDAHHEVVAVHLHDLDEAAVGREAGGAQAGGPQVLPVGVVELEAVAVPLLDDRRVIGSRGPAFAPPRGRGICQAS